MCRLLMLGLLLLTACSDEPVTTGRIEGTLRPFQAAGRSESAPAARPPLLQGEHLQELSRAFSRVLARQQRKEHGAASLFPPPMRTPPLERLPEEDATIAGEVIVRFEQAGLSAQRVQEQLKVPGYRVVHKGSASKHLHLVRLEALDGRAMAAEETGQLVARVAEMPGVRFAEKNLRVYPFRAPNDENYPVQWHYPALNLPAAWDVSVGSDTVTVAVIDSGSAPHPDLTSRLVGGYDMISDPVNAGDGDGRDENPTDRGGDAPGGGSSWHGLHVAGTLGAVTDNTRGVAGVTWATQVVPVRVLGKSGGSSFDIAAAMNWAAGGAVPGVPLNPHPARVINMSLGSAGPPQQSYQDIIDAHVAAGAIFVIAAGNENTDASQVTPCNQQNVLCVGATNLAGKRSSYSNHGTAVDVMAPGGEMSEDLNGDGYADGVLSIGIDQNGQAAYLPKQGTSMAAPHVSGVVALMLAVNPGLGLTQVENILKSTASASSQCAEGCGAGLVNAQAALKKAAGGASDDPPRLGVTPSVLSFRGDGTQQLLLSNLGAGSLRVGVVKTGPLASAVSVSAGTVLVPAFGTQALRVEVNSAGLGDGESSATLTLTGTNADTGEAAGEETVEVRLRVGAVADLDAFIAFAWQDEQKKWHLDEASSALVLAGSGYQYSLSLPAKTWYTVATIDDDQDGKYFEDGERTGFWRNVDDFEPIPLPAGQTVRDISYELVPLMPIGGGR